VPDGASRSIRSTSADPFECGPARAQAEELVQRSGAEPVLAIPAPRASPPVLDPVRIDPPSWASSELGTLTRALPQAHAAGLGCRAVQLAGPPARLLDLGGDVAADAARTVTVSSRPRGVSTAFPPAPPESRGRTASARITPCASSSPVRPV